VIKGDINRYFEEAIKIENNLAEIYLLFSKKFSDDRLFWWTLSFEEKNHAALIESEKLFYKVNAFPEELFSIDIEELININDTFKLKVESFNDNPSKENAFNIALELENSAIELKYQKLLEYTNSDRAINLFKLLNRADKDHAKRIIEYKNKNYKI
jgi:rubrerythrin